jgi:hypothetical protein
VFSRIYLDDDRQIDRRMREQLLSGNIDIVDGRYRVSRRGDAFVRFSRGVAWLFDTDPRFVRPGEPSAQLIHK